MYIFLKDSKFKVKISKILVEIILYCLSEGVHPSGVEPENQHAFRAVDLTLWTKISPNSNINIGKANKFSDSTPEGLNPF